MFAATLGAGTFPDPVVRIIGISAPSIVGSFLIGVVAFAGSIAVLVWKGKFPMWMVLMATLIVFMTVIATVLLKFWAQSRNN